MPGQLIRSFQEPRPLNARCADAAVILERAHESAAALLAARHLSRAERGRPRGISTDDEQDLLRAMLVMAAAGLDAMMKQLVRDTIPVLLPSEANVQDGLEKFVTRRLGTRADTDDQRGRTGNVLLARALISISPQQTFLAEYLDELSGGSLQSPDELTRVAKALGLDPKIVDKNVLTPIFRTRNKILHELDISLERDRRRRNHRGLQDMVKSANTLLGLAEAILGQVNTKLSAE